MSETQLASMFIGSTDDGDDIDRGRPSDGNMIHILDGQTDVILDFITLDNIIDDTHKKSLEDTLETYDFIALADKQYAAHLEKRNRIIIPDEDGTLREFVIFEAAKYRDAEGYKAQVFSHASYLELKKARILYPTRREGLTASQHAGWALNDTGWRVGIVEAEGTRTFTIENHTNPYEFLKRIAREFEVELRFRVEHDGQRIIGRYVDLLERVGGWRGREIEFGKDLDGIRRVEKQDIVTALLGLGPERDDGTRIEVLVTDEEALQRWGRVDEHGNLHHLIEPYEIQSDRQEMTEEEARRYTRTALDKRINTQVTYETTILDLEEVPGLEHEKIRFGDTIRIKDTYFNPPLYLEARVFEIERSIKNKAKKDIKLGDYVEYTEEEVDAIWNQLRNEIRRRLDRIAIVSINSSAGNVFKNAQGETELTARTFVSGAERDEDGTLYDYQWMRFDKDGNHDTDFYAEGKTITVTANDIDEKATYRVLVAYELEVINTAEITISNVFDGEDGEPGPPGPKGDKGDKGDPGPQGPPGTSITSIVEYYLATNQSSGVTTDTPGWTTTMQQMTPTNRYLWNYERINFSDGTYQNTNPVIIGVYGDEGEEGRSVVNITEYYLATSASSGVTRNTSGWTTTMQVTTPDKKYLWNYEKITWNKAPLETYTEPVIIGVHGEQGPKGDKGEDGQGVEDITIEYYLSNSDSTPIGGMWTETKPTYQPGKYLWIRQKITYKNPTAIEYTTPVLDDSWKAVEIADEAKQEAEEAKQEARQAQTTADGKNTVFRQSTQPPTSGRKIGDVWFDTSRDNLMHVFNGTQWVEAKWGEQSIVANSITANHIKSLVGLNVNDQFIVDSNGNVRFSGRLEGASGSFKSEGEFEDEYYWVNIDRYIELGGSYFEDRRTSVTYYGLEQYDETVDRWYYYGWGGMGVFDPNPNSQLIENILMGPTGYISITSLFGEDSMIELLASNRIILWAGDINLTGDVSASNQLTLIERGVSNGLALKGVSGDHIIVGHNITGAFHIYPHRESGENIFTIRSHEDKSNYRNDFWIDSNGDTHTNGDLRVETGNIRGKGLWDITTSNAVNARVGNPDSSGYSRIVRSTSARKYKMFIEEADVDPYKILKLKPKSWIDKGEYIRNGYSTEGLKRYYGIIADDMEEIGLPEYVDYVDGEVENIVERAWTLLIPIVNDILEELEQIKERLERLENEGN